MTAISSSTPEGEPVLCPLCDQRSLIAVSVFPLFDVPCPHCGHLLILDELCHSVEPEFDPPGMIKEDKEFWDEHDEEEWADELPVEMEEPVIPEGTPSIFLELCEITDPMEIGYLERDWAEMEKVAAESAEWFD